jgi:hypothetical protein
MAVHVCVGGFFGCEEVARTVGRVGCWEGLLGEGYDVEVVQKDPEDFLSYADGFLAPYSVRSFLVHVQDKGEQTVGSVRLRVAKVAENVFGSDDALGGRCGGNVCEENRGDDVSSREFTGAFTLWVKDHVEESRKEIGLDVV